MPEKEPLPVSKVLPVTSAPTAEQVRKWQQCLELYQEISDKVFAIRLQSECLNEKALFAASYQFTLNLPDAPKTEQRWFLIEESFLNLREAVSRVQSGQYGLKWRDGDFDILSPNPAMGALFIPILIGGLVLAGCFAAEYYLGKQSDEILSAYKVLNKAADKAICSDPTSEMCKNWQVVKAEKHIEEKESFADKISGAASKGLTVALALVGVAIALSIFKR